MTQKHLRSTASLFLVALLALIVASAWAASPSPFVFSSEARNGVYEDTFQEISPVERGGMTIDMASPDNEITIHGHRIELVPQGERVHRGNLTVEVSGWGDLIADVAFTSGSPPQRFRDRLTIPRQTVDLSGLVLLSKTTDGYVVTPLEMPKTVPVRVESGLADGIVASCEALSRLPFLSLGCSGLGQAFERVQVPLPGPGQSYVLPAGELTADERRQLDGYLAGQ